MKASRLAHASLFTPVLTSEISDSVGYDAVSLGYWLMMFGDIIVVSSSSVKLGIAYVKITPLHCLKMSGTDNPVTQQHIPGEQSPHSHTY